MSQLTASAILLRRIEYGDYDLILTLFSREKGKIAVIAKAAKKSTKRFGGILELFSVLQIVASSGRSKKLPVLLEATLNKPFFNIRADINKTAYASYWAELVLALLEQGAPQPLLFELLVDLLERLDRSDSPEAVLSILFQMRFLLLTGYRPALEQCANCHTAVEQLRDSPLHFQLERGGLLCRKCDTPSADSLTLSLGTIKQLLWLEKGPLATAARIRFSPRAVQEGLRFLETFLPYHLGKEPRSLKFLRQLRG